MRLPASSFASTRRQPAEANIRLLSAEVEKLANLKVEAVDVLKQLQTAGALKQAAANLQAADAIKRASSSGSDVVNEILAGKPQGQASDPFALLENRTITGQPRQITE